MKVLVLWADNRSANLGVRVLAQGMAELAKRAWGDDVTVDFQDFAQGESKTAFGGRAIVKDLWHADGPIKSRLRDFDLVLDSGAGDSFTDIYGYKRLLTMSYVQRSARALRIPLVMGPQTIGPFTTFAGRYLGRTTLRNAASINARDTASARFAQTLGYPVDTTSTDVVFALPRTTALKTRDVLINVSGLLWNTNPHVDAASYRANLTKLCGDLLNAGRTISLLAHVLDNPTQDNDVPAVRELAASLNRDVEVLIPQDLQHAREVLSSANLVIGSRMHACLNALSVGTPAIPWAYSRKFAPLMSDLGWHVGVDLKTDMSPAETTVAILGEKSLRDLTSSVDTVLESARTKLDTSIAALQSISVPSPSSKASS